MAFDFKKEYKEFYMPKNKPGIVSVPSMNYIAVRGSGDPNQEAEDCDQASDKGKGVIAYGINERVSGFRLGTAFWA